MSNALAVMTDHARRELAKVIVGQQASIDLLLLTIVCGGHALIEGVPGVAKTLTVRALARLLDVRFQRVQCTPDLMPGDIVGGNVFNMATSQFVLHQGPVFTDLLDQLQSGLGGFPRLCQGAHPMIGEGLDKHRPGDAGGLRGGCARRACRSLSPALSR